MTIGREIIRLASVTSTMDVCDALARNGAAEGLVVVAEEQTAGRGRAGKSWTAAPGDAVLASILLRPSVSPAQLGQLPLIAGIAVAETIEAVVPVECQLKWPNDVLIAGQKVAGILVQSRLTANAIEQVIVGIGINVRSSHETLPAGATSIAAATGRLIDRDALLESLLEHLQQKYAGWIASGGRAALDRWRARAAFLGSVVSVVFDGDAIEGVLEGIDDDGRLLLVLATGERRAFATGEVELGPRPTQKTVN